MEQEVNMIHCLSATLSLEVGIKINAFEFRGREEGSADHVKMASVAVSDIST